MRFNDNLIKIWENRFQNIGRFAKIVGMLIYNEI